MFEAIRQRNPKIARLPRRMALGPRVEPLDGRVLPSAAISVLPTGLPRDADVGTVSQFTPPIGSDKGSIRAAGDASASFDSRTIAAAHPVKRADLRPPDLTLLGEEPIYYPGM
jgi:hypothetical protein